MTLVQTLRGIRPSDVNTTALGAAMQQKLAERGITADVTVLASLATTTRRHLAQTSQLSTVRTGACPARVHACSPRHCNLGLGLLVAAPPTS